ncbi:MAG: hypothetical protein ACYTDX_02660 [Planctomycetota bacterium]
MRILKWGLMSLVLLVTSTVALAGTDWLDWNDYEYDYSYSTWRYIDGEYVYGTYSYDYDYRWRRNADYSRQQYQGQFRYSFVSADGTITGKGVQNRTYNWKRQSTYANTYVYQMVYTKKGEGVVHKDWYKYHVTYDANGELKSYHYKYD